MTMYVVYDWAVQYSNKLIWFDFDLIWFECIPIHIMHNTDFCECTLHILHTTDIMIDGYIHAYMLSVVIYKGHTFVPKNSSNKP